MIKRFYIVDQSKFLMIADAAAEHLRRLIPQFPHLVTDEVKAAVENWDKFKQWRGSIEITKHEHKHVDQELLVKTAIDLLEHHQMEDVMELLAEQFSIEMDYPRLIGLIGKARYRHALRHETSELQSNKISFEQMAELWNSLGKPAFGNERWTAHSISMLVE
jgi:phage-related minor tail protein